MSPPPSIIANNIGLKRTLSVAKSEGKIAIFPLKVLLKAPENLVEVRRPPSDNEESWEKGAL